MLFWGSLSVKLLTADEWHRRVVNMLMCGTQVKCHGLAQISKGLYVATIGAVKTPSHRSDHNGIKSIIVTHYYSILITHFTKG